MNKINRINKSLWKSLYSAYRYQQRTCKSDQWLAVVGDVYPMKGKSIDILPDALCRYAAEDDPLDAFTAVEKLNARVRVFKTQRVDSRDILKWHQKICNISSKYPTPHECECLYNRQPSTKNAPKLP